jgi:hypothetical protein
MPKLKAFKILFLIAALMFVAKPFLGFSVFDQQSKQQVSHSILVKSFSKRKPESLDDAYAKTTAMHQQLSNPLLVLASAITLLLAVLLSALPESVARLTGGIISNIHRGILPPGPVYLLTCKLTI